MKKALLYLLATLPGIHYILGNAFNKQTRHKINHRTVSVTPITYSPTTAANNLQTQM